MAEKIPDELFDALEMWKNRQKRANKTIKKSTDAWVEAQKKIIKIEDAIKELSSK